MMKRLKADHAIDHFDLIKCNIEGYEYPLFAEVFREPDVHLKGTAQIHLEMHRMGMQDRGLEYNSLVFGELLWAARLVQRAFRGHACRDVLQNARQVKAALLLQSRYRARCGYVRMRQLVAMAQERKRHDAAATTLQSVGRRKKAAKRVEGLRRERSGV